MTMAARAEVRGLAKTFGATRALADADLHVRAGEVHTVMGENGSGKSTLVKILSGVHRPDSGEIVVDGHRAGKMRSPASSRALGISTVFQETLTIPGQSILANIWIGSARTDVTESARRTRARAILGRMLGEEPDVDAPIESLSLSGRQAVCITRSLVRDPTLLILDESTSALDVATRDRLFDLMRDLTEHGTSILFISHRMDEVFEISDVVTVLRAGQTVAARLDAATTTSADLVRLMSGVEAAAERHNGRATADLALTADDVRLAPDAVPISLTLRAGELLGLAGLEGQGQEAFLKALRGDTTDGGEVVRHVAGSTEQVTGPDRARDLGIGYVPRERRREGLFEQLSISENFGLPTLGNDTRFGLIDSRRTVQRLTRFAGPLRVKMGRPRDLIGTLSGGNQQKVILARTLADSPRVLLLNDPTRGIDHTAKLDVYSTLDDLCASGVAIVVLSSEVDELVHLADRVLVFRDGSVSAALDGDAVTRAAIVEAYFGAPSARGNSVGATEQEVADVHHPSTLR